MRQQDQLQDDIITERLEDLPVTEGQANQTKAGSDLFRESLAGEGKKVKIDFCK